MRTRRFLPLFLLPLTSLAIANCGGSDGPFNLPSEGEKGGTEAPPKPAVYARCENNWKTQLWAQLVMGADLADLEMTDLQIPVGLTKVAVVDTGFDYSHRLSAFGAGLTLPERGSADSGDPSLDDEGHGTLVASVVAAKNGIGIAPRAQIKVYRVTTSKSGGHTSDKMLNDSLRKACDDGYEIINESWGDVADESGDTPLEKAQTEFYNKMWESGCLITKSAGNDSYRSHDSGSNLDDALLRVQATIPTGTAASFSSAGEVSAPGEGVFALHSLVQSETLNDWEKIRKTCDQADGRFVSGTSFASPLTAGAAALVLDVLKSKHTAELDAFSRKDRVTLVNRTLKASEIGGTINAYRAVLISERWNGKLSTVEELKLSLSSNPPAFCSAAAPSCKNLGDGADLKTCVNEQRKHIYACPLPGQNATITEAIETLGQRMNIDVAASLFHIGAEAGLYNDTDAGAGAAQLYKVYRHRWGREWENGIRYNLEFDPALELLPLIAYRYTSGSDAQADLKRWSLDLLTSYDFEDRIGRSPGRGSEEALQRLHLLLDRAADRAGISFVVELANTYFADWKQKKIIEYGATSKPELSRLTGAVRFYDQLIGTPRFASVGAGFLKQENDIFNIMNTVDFDVGSVFGYQKFLRSIHSDMDAFYPEYYRNIFIRHQQDVNNLINLNRISLLGGVSILYLLLDQNSPVHDDDGFRALVFSQIARNAGWGDKIDNWITEVFTRDFSRQSDGRKGKGIELRISKNDYWSAVLSSSNTSLIEEALGLSSSDFYFDSSSLADLIQRVGVVLLQEPDRYYQVRGLEAARIMKDAVGRLESRSYRPSIAFPARRVSVSLFPLDESNRFHPGTGTNIELDAPDSFTLAEFLFRKAIEVYGNSPTYITIFPLSHLLDEGADFKALLSKTSGSLVALQNLLAAIRSDPKRFDQDVGTFEKKRLQDAIEEFLRL